MPRRETWIVDALEGDVARVAISGAAAVSVPRRLLPAAAREGSVLTVTRDPDGRARVVLTIEVDEAATAAALERSARQVAELREASREHDPGGDVTL